MTVDFKDQEKNIRLKMMALNSVGIAVNYPTTELIHIALEKAKEKGYQMSISDASKIEVKHQEKWDEYFKEKREIRK